MKKNIKNSDFSVFSSIFFAKVSFSSLYFSILSLRLSNSSKIWLFSTVLVFFKVSSLNISLSFSFNLISESLIFSKISLIFLLVYIFDYILYIFIKNEHFHADFVSFQFFFSKKHY